ncbi:MAG: acetate--CoA ligase family protein [Gaiella sp.]
MTPLPPRDLRPLFAPASVAVVGASADPAKWGNILSRGALRGVDRRPAYLVNRAGGEVLGVPTHTSLASIGERVELVVVAVPAPVFAETVTEALAVGAKAIVGITAGLGELGEEGRLVEYGVVEEVRAAGAVLLGPNCLGVMDASAGLDLGWSALPPGPIGFVSQSGNLALEIAQLAEAAGLGFSRFASLGNQADLVAADLVADFTAHPETRIITLYLEDFRDGRAFVATAARARETGKPVVLLTGGLSRASARAALSHTGALVSDARSVEAACRAAGIVAVATPKQLVDAAQALLAGRFPRGRRVGVYGDGGGHGVVATDVLAAQGLDVPPLSEPTTASLRRHLAGTASLANPVDFATGGEQGLQPYVDVGRVLLSSGDVDAVLLTGYFGGYGVDTPELADEETAVARALGAAAADTGTPLAVHTSYPLSPTAATLRSAGVPTYGDVESAAAALALLARHAEMAIRVPIATSDAQPIGPPAPGYFGARAFLAGGGVPLVDARPATSPEEAQAAAEELGFPVALKAIDLLHKSDAGGVVLGLASAGAVAEAAVELMTRLGTRELSVERMAPLREGVELIVGAKRDLRFGATVLVGIGGVLAEVLQDVQVALAPVDESTAREMLLALRGAALLTGSRGRPALDLDSAAAVVADVSRLAAACPALHELDVNPLLVLPQGALALDARAIVT